VKIKELKDKKDLFFNVPPLLVEFPENQWNGAPLYLEKKLLVLFFPTFGSIVI
jgi:hypothetical protein